MSYEFLTILFLLTQTDIWSVNWSRLSNEVARLSCKIPIWHKYRMFSAPTFIETRLACVFHIRLITNYHVLLLSSIILFVSAFNNWKADPNESKFHRLEWVQCIIVFNIVMYTFVTYLPQRCRVRPNTDLNL